MRGTIFFFSSCVCLCFLFVFIKFFQRVWWRPFQIRNVMRSQGIKGPSYRILHGSTKEILKMTQDSMATPMDLSHDIFPRLSPHFYLWLKLYGRNFVHWLGPRAQLVVTEPEWIKEILHDRDGAYPKTEVEDYIKKLLGDGLVISEGEKWAKLRKLANHAFHSESLKDMFPAMVESVEVMMGRWRNHEGKEIEVCHEFMVLTSEVISRTAFGSSYLEGENIFKMLMEMSLIVSKKFYVVRIPCIERFAKTQDDRELDRLERAIRDCVIGMLRRREQMAMTTSKTDSFGSDFLGLLVKAYKDNDKNKRISIDDLVDECKTFYIAGHETTATLLTWAVLLLAIHIDWQEKARREVLEVFGQRHPNPEGIARLKIMSMIINESLRLYPPVIHITRRVGREVGLGGKLTLPANIEVCIPTLALHHDPNIWGEDVHSFKPQRFAGGVAKATNNNTSAFLPFSSGPRTCVGLNFGITEAKIALSMILQRYEFDLSPEYVHAPVHLLTIQPKHGVQVILRPLKDRDDKGMQI